MQWLAQNHITEFLDQVCSLLRLLRVKRLKYMSGVACLEEVHISLEMFDNTS